MIAAHGCYAMTATAALTAQNTQGVYGIHSVPPAFLKQQIDACLDDIGTDVVKTGALEVDDLHHRHGTGLKLTRLLLLVIL